MNRSNGTKVVTFHTLKEAEAAAIVAEKEASVTYYEAKKTFEECLKEHASEESKVVKALAFNILKDAQQALKNAQTNLRKATERVRVFGYERRGAVSQNGRSIRR